MAGILCNVLTYFYVVFMFLILFKSKVIVENIYLNIHKYRNMSTKTH